MMVRVGERLRRLRRAQLIDPVVQRRLEVDPRDAEAGDGKGVERVAQRLRERPVDREDEHQRDADREQARRAHRRVPIPSRAARLSHRFPCRRRKNSVTMIITTTSSAVGHGARIAEVEEAQAGAEGEQRIGLRRDARAAAGQREGDVEELQRLGEAQQQHDDDGRLQHRQEHLGQHVERPAPSIRAAS